MFGGKKEKRTVRWRLCKASVEGDRVYMPENAQAVGITIERIPFRKSGETEREYESEMRDVFQVHYVVPDE